MLKIKLSNLLPIYPLLRQTPEGNGIWGGCQFYYNQPIEECDAWVVYGGLPSEEKVRCSSRNTIFIAGEPPSVTQHKRQFLDQFGTKITTQKKSDDHTLITNPALPWMIGVKFDFSKPGVPIKPDSLDYSFFKNHQINKTQRLSVIVSSRKVTAGHTLRIKFIEQLQAHFKDKIHIYGKGFHTLEDKWDGIAPYQYTIALENSVYPHYWTEKLSDAFLGEAYPIYYGAPDIFDYFGQDSLSCIDITKPKEAIQTIEQIMSENLFETHRNAILRAKKLVLDQYNLFAVIEKIVNDRLDLNAAKKDITLYPESHFVHPIKKWVASLIYR